MLSSCQLYNLHLINSNKRWSVVCREVTVLSFAIPDTKQPQNFTRENHTCAQTQQTYTNAISTELQQRELRQLRNILNV